jgi:outer membrane protein assembly factor BamB
MSKIRITTVAISASKKVCLLSMVVLLAAGVCFGKPAVSLSRKSGPPTTKFLVSGSGYKPYAEIDIYFDTKDEAKAVANGSGKFSKISIEAPRSALPGKHWVSAVQRPGDKGAQAPFSVNTNWSQFGFTPDLKRLNPYENVLSPSTVGSLDLLWTYTTGGSVQSSPSIADGTVFVGSNDGNVYALKAGTGAVLWSFPYGYPSESAVANGMVYVNCLDALNASTGTLLWNSGVGGPGPPTLANGVLYLGSVDEDYAVNASDGSLVWQAHWGYRTAGSAAYANELIYLCNDVLYALDAATGGDSIIMGAGCTDAGTSPAVADGVVYVGWGNVVEALNASTGAVLWSYPTGNTIEGPPAVANGVVYIGSDDNNLYALNANTGTLLWTYTTGGFVTSAPAVANGVVYVGSDDNKLYALNASTGALLWSYTTGGSVESSPAIANGVLYVGSDDGNLYAFGLTGGARGKGISAKQEAASNPPDLRALRPDFNLKVSKAAAEDDGD